MRGDAGEDVAPRRQAAVRFDLVFVEHVVDRVLAHGVLDPDRQDRPFADQAVELPLQIGDIGAAEFHRPDRPGLPVAVDDQVGEDVTIRVTEERFIAVDEDIDQALALAVLLELAHRAPLFGSLRESDDVGIIAVAVSRGHRAGSGFDTGRNTQIAPMRALSAL